MSPVQRPLRGRVAVVTGASRGAGKGIAIELGAAGATVYVTGRSTRAQPATIYARILELSQLPRMPGCSGWRTSHGSTASPTSTVDRWRRSSSGRAEACLRARCSGPLHPAVHQLLQQLGPAQARPAQLPVHRADERCRETDGEHRLLTVAARPDGTGGGATAEQLTVMAGAVAAAMDRTSALGDLTLPSLS